VTNASHAREEEVPAYLARQPRDPLRWLRPGRTETSVPESVSPVEPVLPPGEQPKSVNTRHFTLPYDLEGAGADTIERIELWGTRDGGQSWSSFGLDADRRSPFDVTVDEDGIFGFRLTVHARGWPAQPPPRAGALADVWIAVDGTRPEVRLTSARLDQSGRRLRIEWRATDRRLAARPIALYFAERLEGPWSLIAAGLENTGRFDWLLDEELPPAIYLRLHARDAAGNVGAWETTEPVGLHHGTGGIPADSPASSPVSSPAASATGEADAPRHDGHVIWPRYGRSER
jgi:hypothetical protein